MSITNFFVVQFGIFCTFLNVQFGIFVHLDLATLSAGEGADMTELQAHYCLTSKQQTWHLRSVSYGQMNCHCKN